MTLIMLTEIGKYGSVMMRTLTVPLRPLAAAILLATGLSSALAAHCAPAPREPDCKSVSAEPGREEEAVVELRELLSANVETCLSLSGQFPLAAPLVITSAASGLRVGSSKTEPATLIAVGGNTRGIEVIEAPNVTIERLELTGFAHDGIFASNTRNLTIRLVTVKETGSTAWSQGSIHLTGSSTGALVEANTVEDAGYAGIIVDTNTTSDISNVSIRNNHVMRSCQRVHDCGAIYVNDRGRRSRNILLADNVIADFGPLPVGGRGIYVDDWASHVTVRRNRISGPGRFAFQIHGGHHNRIIGNHIDMIGIASPLLYQAAADGTREVMIGNTMTGNVFHHSLGGLTVFATSDRAGAGALGLKRNRQCIAGRCKRVP